MSVELGESVLVLLAGGRSERFGGVKGLALVQGTPLLRWQIERYFDAGGGSAVVVVGDHAEAYRAVLAATPVQIVRNPAPERGPFTSLQAGLAVARPGRKGALFVLPVDVPAPEPATWRALAEATDADAALPELGGRGGHPVRLSPNYAAYLQKLPAEDPAARLDVQLRALPSGRSVRVPVSDARIHCNFNTRAAFEAWESGLDKVPAPNNS